MQEANPVWGDGGDASSSANKKERVLGRRFGLVLVAGEVEFAAPMALHNRLGGMWGNVDIVPEKGMLVRVNMVCLCGCLVVAGRCAL